MDTIKLTIPADWLKGNTLSQDELRRALKLGLAQLRQEQQADHAQGEKVVKALINTGRVKHLATIQETIDTEISERQPPPTLPGPSVSEILVSQRKGDM
jgi:hypothetical protein